MNVQPLNIPPDGEQFNDDMGNYVFSGLSFGESAFLMPSPTDPFSSGDRFPPLSLNLDMKMENDDHMERSSSPAMSTSSQTETLRQGVAQVQVKHEDRSENNNEKLVADQLHHQTSISNFKPLHQSSLSTTASEASTPEFSYQEQPYPTNVRTFVKDPSFISRSSGRPSKKAATFEEFVEFIRPLLSTQHNSFVKKIDSVLPKTNVADSVQWLQKALCILIPTCQSSNDGKGRYHGKDKRLTWLLPDQRAFPMPSLLCADDIRLPPANTVTMSTWLLPNLNIDEYNCAKEMFFLALSSSSSNNHPFEKKKRSKNKKSPDNSGRLVIFGRLSSNEAAIPIRFQSVGMRFTYTLDQLCPHLLKGSHDAIVSRTRVFFDIVNLGDNRRHDPQLKIKVLHGYGRLDFNIIMHSAGRYLLNVSLEKDAHCTNDLFAAMVPHIQTVNVEAYFGEKNEKVKQYRVPVQKIYPMPGDPLSTLGNDNPGGRSEADSSTSDDGNGPSTSYLNRNKKRIRPDPMSLDHTSGDQRNNFSEYKKNRRHEDSSDGGDTTTEWSVTEGLSPHPTDHWLMPLNNDSGVAPFLAHSDYHVMTSFGDDGGEEHRSSVSVSRSSGSSEYESYDDSRETSHIQNGDAPLVRLLRDLVADSVANTNNRDPTVQVGANLGDQQRLYEGSGSPRTEILSQDGRHVSLCLKCPHGEWNAESDVFFYFGKHVLVKAIGQLNPFDHQERCVFIPPIPEQVWTDALKYVASLTFEHGALRMDQYGRPTTTTNLQGGQPPPAVRVGISPRIVADVVVGTNQQIVDCLQRSQAGNGGDVELVSAVGALAIGHYKYPSKNVTLPSLVIEGDGGRGGPGPDPRDPEHKEDDDNNGGGGGGGNSHNRFGNGAGSSAGVMIDVRQEFLIPYSNLHALVLQSCNPNLFFALSLPHGPVSLLVKGLLVMIQTAVGRRMAVQGGSDPKKTQAMLKEFFFSPDALPVSLRKAAKQSESAYAAAALAHMCFRVLMEEAAFRSRALSIKEEDAFGFTLAHYVCVLGRFCLPLLRLLAGSSLQANFFVEHKITGWTPLQLLHPSLLIKPLLPFPVVISEVAEATSSDVEDDTIIRTELEEVEEAEYLIRGKKGYPANEISSDEESNSLLPPSLSSTRKEANNNASNNATKTTTAATAEYVSVEVWPSKAVEARLLTGAKVPLEDESLQPSFASKVISGAMSMLSSGVIAGVTAAAPERDAAINLNTYNIDTTDDERDGLMVKKPHQDHPLQVVEGVKNNFVLRHPKLTILAICLLTGILVALLIILFKSSLFSNDASSSSDPVIASFSTAIGPLSFPGAEGFGAYASGGRGGRTIFVTNLNPSGPGSLQAAVLEAGQRVVVFRVAGVITGNIRLIHGDLTIAGATAPPPGITVVGSIYQAPSVDFPVLRNVILQFIRFRPGLPPLQYRAGGSQADWSVIHNEGTLPHALYFPRASVLMLDHITASWSVGPLLNLGESQYVTVQWCTLEEPAKVHFIEPASGRLSTTTSALVSTAPVPYLSLRYNLIAKSLLSNPAVRGSPVEIINNVIYNFQEGFRLNNNANYLLNLNRDPASAQGVRIEGNVYKHVGRQGESMALWAHEEKFLMTTPTPPVVAYTPTPIPTLSPSAPAFPIMTPAAPAAPYLPSLLDFYEELFIKDNLVEEVGVGKTTVDTVESFLKAHQGSSSTSSSTAQPATSASALTAWVASLTDTVHKTWEYMRKAKAEPYNYGENAAERSRKPVALSPILTPDQAYALVLEKAGTLPHDMTSSRVKQEVVEGRGWLGRVDPPIKLGTLLPHQQPAYAAFLRENVAANWQEPPQTSNGGVLASGFTAVEEYNNRMVAIRLAVGRLSPPVNQLYKLVVLNGWTDKSPTGQMYRAGQEINLYSNVPPPGYAFDHWVGNVESMLDVGTRMNSTLLMPAAEIQVTALFRAV